MRLLLLLLALASSASAAQPDATDLDTQIGLLSEALADTSLAPDTRDSLAARRDALVGEARASDSLRTAEPAAGAGPVPGDGDSDSGTGWPVLAAGLAAALALGGGGAYWYLQRRDAPAVRTSVRTSSSRLPMTGAERTAQDIASGTATFYATSAQVDALARQVDGQRRELDDLRKWITDDHNRREAQRTPAVPAPVQQAPSAPTLSPADAAAAAFADWCRRATPMMSKVDFFANALAERLPGTSVRAVYRDLNSQAEPVRFDGSGGASPAEFWLVSVGGEALVFPQPLNAHQFRDLTRIFEGTATPASLQSVVPARVRDEGAAFALVAPGRVSG